MIPGDLEAKNIGRELQLAFEAAGITTSLSTDPINTSPAAGFSVEMTEDRVPLTDALSQIFQDVGLLKGPLGAIKRPGSNTCMLIVWQRQS